MLLILQNFQKHGLQFVSRCVIVEICRFAAALKAADHLPKLLFVETASQLGHRLHHILGVQIKQQFLTQLFKSPPQLAPADFFSEFVAPGGGEWLWLARFVGLTEKEHCYVIYIKIGGKISEF